MNSSEADSFAVGILYSKKGMPRPEKDALEQASVSTKKTLTTGKAVPFSPFTDKVRLAVEIRRSCTEIFKRRITVADLEKPYAPSIKANYVDSRSDFGTFGTLMDEAMLMDRVAPSKAAQLYQNAVCVDSSIEEIEDENVLRLRVSDNFRKEVEQVYREVYQNARQRAIDEEANVKLVALPEALKVRVISKGPPLTYFTLKPVQKFLHSQMRRIPTFSLVGETVTPHHLNEMFEEYSGLFHSLDYQSATDLLDPELSGVAVDGICDAVGMPEDIRTLFHKALTGHLIEDVPQVWGQLMGSIVSFIVLCVINGAVIRHSYEIEHERSVDFINLPCLVNGDDGLVRSSQKFSDIWTSVALVAGLVPSVGKVYTSATYVNINSTSYQYINEKFVLIPYVNMGLVMGLGRSGLKKSILGADESYENPFTKSFGARHHALIESCPPDKRLAVHELFLQHNIETLKSVRVPWYIPESLGGFGLKPLIGVIPAEDIDDIKTVYLRTSTGHRCGPSPLDVKLALNLRERRHREYTVGKVPSSQPIMARPVWQQPINAFWRHRQHVVMSESDETFMDLATYYMTPSLVAVKLDTRSQTEVARRNERAWTSLINLMDGYVSSGEDLFLGDEQDGANTKSKVVKTYRLIGADELTHQPVYLHSNWLERPVLGRGIHHECRPDEG
jgi:hypothetical protein